MDDGRREREREREPCRSCIQLKDERLIAKGKRKASIKEKLGGRYTDKRQKKAGKEYVKAIRRDDNEEAPPSPQPI